MFPSVSDADSPFLWPSGPEVAADMWKGREPNDDDHYCCYVTDDVMRDKRCHTGSVFPYVKCVVFVSSCDMCTSGVLGGEGGEGGEGAAQGGVLESAFMLDWP